MKIALAAILLLAAAQAQSWDTTGNNLLNGKYYFREIIITPSAAVSLYGNIAFNGNGTFTISATGFQCTTSCSNPTPYQTSGTYSIAASGFGFLSNALIGSSTIGSVGANGVFIGSATESGTNDLFIAAPISGQALGTLNGSYALSYLTPNVFSQSGVPYGAALQFNSSGGGAIGNVTLAAYQTTATPTTQTIGSVKYRVSNNAFVITFPTSTTNLLTGDEYLYSTPDGSFVFGGSPIDFDMIVGVRTGSPTSATLSGLYYEAGFDFDNSSAASGNIGQDTFYGAFNAFDSSIIGHQRLQDGSGVYGYVYHDINPVELNGTYTDLPRSRQFTVGGGVRIGVGLGPFPAITVAVQAAKPSPGNSMYLDPTSAINTASNAPFTSGISSGELVTLNGTNLGPANLAVAGTTPLPTTLAGVQVLLNNHAVPLLSVSSTQLIIQVPFKTTSGTALIQVAYKGAQSNIISALVNVTTPGVFTTPLGGINRASARHANGTLVTPTDPAKVGETVSVYLTGLGDLTVNVPDGAVGPITNPAKPASAIAVFVGGIPATPSLLALAPGLVGLYQMKLLIPAGVTTGDLFLDISGPDSYSTQATISVTSSTTGIVTRQRPTRSFRRPLTIAKPF